MLDASTFAYAAGLAIIAAVAWGIAVPLLRVSAAAMPATPPGDPERHRLEKQRDLAYAAIKEAEFDFQMGKLSSDDYAALRRTYEARAIAAMTELDRRR
jgi:hypothetical protein